MPSPAEILAGLHAISNAWWGLAILWHIYFATLAGAILIGYRGSRRVWGVLLALPLLSVSALAWHGSNPFNGTLFALAGVGLIAIALHLPAADVRIASLRSVIPGALLFVFGWSYPHFLDTEAPWAYLYAAPTGLVPCPTLSIVIGLALVFGGLGSHTWSLLLTAISLFYGVFGAARLGVVIDWILVLGTLVFIGTTIYTPTRTPTRTSSRRW